MDTVSLGVRRVRAGLFTSFGLGVKPASATAFFDSPGLRTPAK